MVNKKKAQSKKQQKRGGVDFKKIKRKIGRKLPPPKNTTNTEIKSKAIILPEQSVAAEKTGLAVSKKGLTLKELLQQTSHHNAKVRRDALIGIRDIFLKHPAELKLHKLPAIEKLRERICDDDKLVRETLYQLFKKVVLPSCKSDQDNPVSFISLMMLYIFNAMTHLAIDVRVMAFKFLDLIVQNYPSSFLSYSEKILQNFEDILRKSQFQLQDQSKLESILAGLVHCLALLPSNKRVDDSTIENEDPQPRLLHTSGSDAIKNSSEISGLTERLKDLLPILVGCFSDAQSFDCKLFILESIDLGVKFFVHETQKSQKCPHYDLHLYGKRTAACNPILSSAIFKKLWNVFPLKGDKRHFVLNAIIAEIFLRLSEWDCPNPDLLENFLGFLESSLTGKISNNSKGSGEAFHEKHLLPLIPFIPKLGLRIGDDWRSRILKAFNEVFKNSSPESTLKLACLSVLEEILDQENGWGSLFATNPEMLHYLGIWTNELSLLLVSLDDKHPECSKAVLHLQLNLGKTAMLNVSFTQNYDQLQDKFKDFYSTSLDGKVACGPFIRLTRDIQELSLSCLCYFSALHSPLLQSLASCCLSPDMEPSLLLRIIEVLQSTYKAGNVPTVNYISFLITLLSRFKVYPEDMHPIKGPEGTSNRETFRSLCNVVRSSLFSIGDEYVVLQMLEKTILDQMSLNLPVDNICGFLRVLNTLDSKPTRLSEENIIKLSHVLPGYLIHVITSCVQDDHVPKAVEKMNSSRYYLLPCFFLFDRSSKLLHLFLNSLKSLIAEEVPLPVPHHTRSTINYSNNIYSILSLLLLMYEDIKMERILLPHKTHIKSITEEVAKLQSSGQLSISIEESHKIKTALTRLESKLADH